MQNAALQAHRVTMYSQMQHLRQQLHLDVHRQHWRLQQLLQEQQVLQQQGQDATLNTQICPVKRQMAALLGGVDDTVSTTQLQRPLRLVALCTCCLLCSYGTSYLFAPVPLYFHNSTAAQSASWLSR